MGFIGALEVLKGKFLTAIFTSLPVKGKTELVIQLEKLPAGFRAIFLISTVHTFHCQLGLLF